MQNIKKIIFGVFRNIVAFMVGGVLGVLSVFIFAKPILETTVKKDIGLGIIAVAPAVIIIYGVLFGVGGGILGVIAYNFVKYFWKKKNN